MASHQEIRSVESEYSEYTLEDSGDDDAGEEGNVRSVPQPQHLPESEDEDEEYPIDPPSIVARDTHIHSPSPPPPRRASSPRPSNDMEKILRIQNRRIQMLLQSNKAKEEHNQRLEHEMNQQKVKHKEGIYWLQLQLDTARREKDASEERMAELQADLQEMVRIEGHGQGEVQQDEDAEKAELHWKLHTYETSMDVMENQLSMMNTSCGEVIKTLKDEIADLMDGRSRMEVDLLNQLVTLDSKKKQSELEYELRLSEKEEQIERLQMRDNGKETSSSDVRSLKLELEKLHALKEQAVELARKERAEADEVIHWLKKDKANLEMQLEATTKDMALLRSEISSTDAAKVLNRVTHERDAVNASLARVTAVWEMADASVSNLEEAIEQLRPSGSGQVGHDGEKMLTTLESVSLLHGQIKVSLLLIEVKLKNQLQCLTNDKLTMGNAAPSDSDITRSMEEIQKDALNALGQVESALTMQMTRLKESALEEMAKTKIQLKERVLKLDEMKEGYRRLEAEVVELKNSNQGSDCYVKSPSSDGEQSEEKKDNGQSFSISAPVMHQLHKEVMLIVERIQEKNKIIEALREELEEQKKREENLRKELKRSLRANHASYRAAKNSPRTPTTIHSPPNGAKSKIKRLSPAEKKQLSSSPLTPPTVPVKTPIKSPIKTPAKVKDALSAHYGPGKSPLSTSSALYSPNSSIKPISPSPREIARPRHSATSPPWASGAVAVEIVDFE